MQVDTDPDPPEERTLDSVVLSVRSGKKQVKDVWHSTDLDSLLAESAVGVGLTSRDHSRHLGFRKGYAFHNADSLNLLLLLPDRAIFSQ